MMEIKIGDTLFRFDANRRIYRDRSFSGGGAPIYREHFEPLKIIGETRKSWILERDWKASKKDLKSAESMQYGGRGFFTAQGMEDDIWLHDHLYRVKAKLDQASPDILRKVAELIGYTAKALP